MEIARTDRVWPHGSRAERAHPTELCSTWKATKRAGPYFWRMRGGAPRVIINRTNFDSSTLPPRKIFPFLPRMRRMSVENIVYTWNRGTNFLFFFFYSFSPYRCIKAFGGFVASTYFSVILIFIVFKF